MSSIFSEEKLKLMQESGLHSTMSVQFAQLYKRVLPIIQNCMPEEWHKVSNPADITELVLREFFLCFYRFDTIPGGVKPKTIVEDMDKKNKAMWARKEISDNYLKEYGEEKE